MRVGWPLVASFALPCLSGCGGVYYGINAASASSRLEQAKEAGAEKYAPYEYYYAKAHLQQAQIEAAEASYGDAAAYADTAEEYAQKAIEIAQAAQRAGQKP
jgi:hypothetical protein